MSTTAYFDTSMLRGLTRFTVKSQPDIIEELKAKYTAIGKPFNCSPKEWIGIRFGGDVDDNELKKLITNSYDIIKNE